MTAEAKDYAEIKSIVDIPDGTPEIEVDDINAYYGNKHVLKNISMKILPRRVTALIGPSGCGKSTFLRVLNRMNDYIEGFRLEGKVYFKGIDIYSDEIPIEELRSRIGMVFQKPNPFPQSIYDNVAFGLRIRGIKKKSILDETVEWALQQSALWDEVKDRLKDNAYSLSGGQQQRLCIARALATKPEVLLMDEPTSALDPIATTRIEKLISELGKEMTVILVTHNIHQAGRVSHYAAFFYLGHLVEYSDTKKLLTAPSHPLTESYVTGRMG